MTTDKVRTGVVLSSFEMQLNAQRLARGGDVFRNRDNLHEAKFCRPTATERCSPMWAGAGCAA
jgi:hypothetical protein